MTNSVISFPRDNSKLILFYILAAKILFSWLWYQLRYRASAWFRFKFWISVKHRYQVSFPPLGTGKKSTLEMLLRASRYTEQSP